jgi:hypothetical protein
MSYDALQQAADKLGRERGHAAGTWVIDGNTSEDIARAIVKGYEDGEPEVMDMQPAPLSGEWADDPTVKTVLRDIADEAGDEIDADSESDLLDIFEMAYSDGYWNEIIRSANAILTSKEQ